MPNETPYILQSTHDAEVERLVEALKIHKEATTAMTIRMHELKRLGDELAACLVVWHGNDCVDETCRGKQSLDNWNNATK